MIEITELCKDYGRVPALQSVSFGVQAGTVVGFLGRNGAGKSTTLRILAGLTTATSGTATIDGKPYRQLREPLKTAGFGLDAETFYAALSGRRTLSLVAARVGVGRGRIREVLELVELSAAADRIVGGYSLGMRQRLLLACSMLGDPQAIVLDEPTNGLDPQGHRWLRDFLKQRASEGRAVLLSSHVLGDVAETVDRAVVLANGQIVADAPIAELAGGHEHVRVQTPDPGRLITELQAAGATVERGDPGTLLVTGIERQRVGELASLNGITLHELVSEIPSLEESFFALTEGGRELGR